MALTQISTAGVKDDLVTAAKIADDAVTEALIADDSVDEARLKISNAGSNGQYLQKQSGNTGGLTWATVSAGMTDIVSDTSPQLGGDLDTNSFEISLDDSHAVKFGDSNDLKIYHDGTDNYIYSDNKTLWLNANGSDIRINPVNAENSGRFIANGAVELYYDGTKKFETSSSGVTLSDGLHLDNATNAGRDAQWQPASDRLAFFDNVKATFGDGVDLQIYHNGSHSYIDNGGTGSLYIRSNNTIALMDDSGDEMLAKFVDNAACELYYDNSKKLETLSNGVRVTGQVDVNGGGISLEDNRKLYCGTGDDFEIYHDGTNNQIIASAGYIKVQATNGDAYFRGDIVRLESGDGNHTFFKGTENGNAELYYDHAKKLETKPQGVQITGHTYQTDGNGSYYGTSDDLQIYHDGTNSNIINTGGDLYIQTGAAKGIYIRPNNGENGIVLHPDGAVDLYHNNAKKFETTSSGATVSGTLVCTALNAPNLVANMATNGYNINFGDSHSGIAYRNRLRLGDGADLQLYHDGSNSYIEDAGAGSLVVQSNHYIGRAGAYSFMNTANSETIIYGAENGAVNLYYDGSKKFETSSTGIALHGLTEGQGNASLFYNSSTGQVLWDQTPGGGKVLQVLHYTKTDTWSQGSIACGNVSDNAIQLDITPSSSSSKILISVSVMISFNSDANRVGAVLRRGGTELGVGNADGNRQQVTASTVGDNDTAVLGCVAFTYLDSPSTTSAITYGVGLSHGSGSAKTMYLNRGGADANNCYRFRSGSHITLQEIAG